MRNYFFLAFLALAAIGNAQTKPSTYVIVDYIKAYPVKSGAIGKSDYYYINPYVCKTFGKKGNIGVFVESVIEPEAWSINPGIMFVKQIRNTYHEFGIGPGFEFSKASAENKEQVTYLNTYYYLENHAASNNAHGKFSMNLCYSYAPSAWGSWWQVYAMYTAIGKTIDIGVYSQQFVVDIAPRIAWKPSVQGIRPTIWLSGWGDRFAVGINLSRQWEKKHK